MSRHNEVVVSVDDTHRGMRLDLFLSLLPQIGSRSVATKMIRGGRVLLNGEVVSKGGIVLKGGEEVRLSLQVPESPKVEPQNIPLNILYEDDHLLVVNKEAGMVVHPSKGHDDGTLVNALLAHCGGLPSVGDVLRPGIVHRLDKGTSGVLVVAKNEDVHRRLVEAFSGRMVTKTYLAFLHGVIQPAVQTVSAPIARHPRHRTMMAVVERGREAVSRFKVISKARGFSLVKVEIATGRTHQIRVHARHIGHPIVGDGLYGRKGDDSRFGIFRPALHAWVLELQHPIKGEKMRFEAPLPPDLVELAYKLGVEIPGFVAVEGA